MSEIDMTPRTAGLIEAAAELLRLSARTRPELMRWDHKAFAATGLQLLHSDQISVHEIESAVETATRQEGIK